MDNEEISSDQADKSERTATPGALTRFVGDEDIGLGDVIKHVTYAVGIKPCGGCEQRAATLNRWMIFTSRRGK